MIVRKRGSFGLMALLLLVAACAGAPSRPAAVGAPVPATELTLLDGSNVTLEQLAGQPVLLNFWATWCVPCRAELPALAGVAAAHADADLAVIAVNLHEDAELAGAFLERIRVDLPAALDPDGALARAYGVVNLPTSILIGPDGTIVARHVGYLDETGITALLEPVLR
jgi:thiol-disulfide isomerase/thioredoxin